MQEDKSDTPLLLIPAAGFGTRVGSPEAKELLDEGVLRGQEPSGRPLIQWALEQGVLRGWRTHVVSRKGKTALADYLRRQSQKNELLTWDEIEISQDWPETLAGTQSLWPERVLVLLPDTRFEPLSVLDEMDQRLREHDLVYATFEVDQPQTWGVIKESRIFEKCAEGPAPHLAWGVVGFSRRKGAQVLASHLRSMVSGEPADLPCAPVSCTLQSFQDLARQRVL